MASPLLVLDTNVLVSALLRPANPPGQVLDAVVAGAAALAFDDRILAEYRDVLHRPRFGFDPRDVDLLLDHLERSGMLVPGAPLPIELPDPDDRPFLEVAAAARADALVTGNRKHFPELAVAGLPVRVLSPAEWLSELRTSTA